MSEPLTPSSLLVYQMQTPCERSVDALVGCACSEQPGHHNSSIDVEESMWVLDEDLNGSNDVYHSLMINLVRPAITPEEVTWKKGWKPATSLVFIGQQLRHGMLSSHGEVGVFGLIAYTQCQLQYGLYGAQMLECVCYAQLPVHVAERLQQ